MEAEKPILVFPGRRGREDGLYIIFKPLLIYLFSLKKSPLSHNEWNPYDRLNNAKPSTELCVVT